MTTTAGSPQIVPRLPGSSAVIRCNAAGHPAQRLTATTCNGGLPLLW